MHIYNRHIVLNQYYFYLTQLTLFLFFFKLGLPKLKFCCIMNTAHFFVLLRNMLYLGATLSSLWDLRFLYIINMYIEVNMLFCIVLCCIALHCIALHCLALRCVALRCIALRCVALRCVALRCVALRCVVIIICYYYYYYHYYHYY